MWFEREQPFVGGALRDDPKTAVKETRTNRFTRYFAR